MASFNKSPLPPTAMVSEPNPKGSQDGSFSLLSNQSLALANLAPPHPPPRLSWGVACFVAWGSGSNTELSSFTILSTDTERAVGRCENRSRDWGRRQGNSILNRFILKKESGYLTLRKNLTPLSALRETPASQLCCHTLNPHPGC